MVHVFIPLTSPSISYWKLLDNIDTSVASSASNLVQNGHSNIKNNNLPLCKQCSNPNLTPNGKTILTILQQEQIDKMFN